MIYVIYNNVTNIFKFVKYAYFVTKVQLWMNKVRVKIVSNYIKISLLTLKIYLNRRKIILL